MSSSGYMAPEYATQGQLSIKSDVYSFGVLVLEIVTGLKNSSFDESESSYDLLSSVWRHWTEGTRLELIDKTLCKDCPSSERLLPGLTEAFCLVPPSEF
ncbi:hypothetical protein MRB53_021267 [Persea americana]|uniref:Uncharacterized protein n=1 Tax=Persea americana TaxID=3435 RepID=A0ACC2L3G1_PERAE|nr:hypothetical protein MRB53_021267 [Persea americana]